MTFKLHKEEIEEVQEVMENHFPDFEQQSVTHTGYRDFIDTIYIEFTAKNKMPDNLFESFYEEFHAMSDIFSQFADLDITILTTFYPPNHIIIVMIFTNKEET